MKRYIATLMLAALAASPSFADAGRQTHEFMSCREGLKVRCFGDTGEVVVEVSRLHDLYRDGWRLIAVHEFQSSTMYYVERPINSQAQTAQQ